MNEEEHFDKYFAPLGDFDGNWAFEIKKGEYAGVKIQYKEGSIRLVIPEDVSDESPPKILFDYEIIDLPEESMEVDKKKLDELAFMIVRYILQESIKQNKLKIEVDEAETPKETNT